MIIIQPINIHNNAHQNEILFNLGNAISIAPIITGKK